MSSRWQPHLQLLHPLLWMLASLLVWVSPRLQCCIYSRYQRWSWHSERETGGFLQERKFSRLELTLERKDSVSFNFWKSSISKTFSTYFNRKSWREFQGNKVSQTCKVWAGSRHEVNNRGHLLHQGEGMILTHPQGTFKSSWQHNSDR